MPTEIRAECLSIHGLFRLVVEGVSAVPAHLSGLRGRQQRRDLIGSCIKSFCYAKSKANELNDKSDSYLYFW